MSDKPFGDAMLLNVARRLCYEIEKLPAGQHQTMLASHAGQVAQGLAQLQKTGTHFWPTVKAAGSFSLVEAMAQALPEEAPAVIRRRTPVVEPEAVATGVARYIGFDANSSPNDDDPAGATRIGAHLADRKP